MQRSKVAQIYKVKTDKHDTYGNCFTLQDQGGETQPIGQNWRVKKEQGTKGTIKRLAWIAASKGGTKQTSGNHLNCEIKPKKIMIQEASLFEREKKNEVAKYVRTTNLANE